MLVIGFKAYQSDLLLFYALDEYLTRERILKLHSLGGSNFSSHVVDLCSNFWNFMTTIKIEEFFFFWLLLFRWLWSTCNFLDASISLVYDRGSMSFLSYYSWSLYLLGVTIFCCKRSKIGIGIAKNKIRMVKIWRWRWKYEWSQPKDVKEIENVVVRRKNVLQDCSWYPMHADQ